METPGVTRGTFRDRSVFLTCLGVALALGFLVAGAVSPAVEASSHREAPLIARDPLADNTDVYAFVSTETGRSDRVVLISNWIPLQKRESGPNFWGFDDDGLYDIRIDNDADAREDVTYQFRFSTTRQTGSTFLYNTGEVTSLTDADLNIRQSYSVTRVRGATTEILATGLAVAPAHVGRTSMPDYATLRTQAIHTLPDGSRVFAGPRAEGFYVDLGAVFDLLRINTVLSRPPVNATSATNVESIALEVPKQLLTRTGLVPQSPDDPAAIVGIWSTTSRRQTTVLRRAGRTIPRGSFVQVSRLGMPLVNEVVIPLKDKDRFNGSHPKDDAQFAVHVTNSELAGLLRTLFSVNVPAAPRKDLEEVFLTGVPNLNKPPGVKPAEMLRLNVAVAPAASPNRLGVLAGDSAGFPNGRRVADDVVDIELRVVAGVLVSGFDVGPNKDLSDGVDGPDVPFLAAFPFLADPHPAR
jgi:hypothetical protein